MSQAFKKFHKKSILRSPAFCLKQRKQLHKKSCFTFFFKKKKNFLTGTDVDLFNISVFRHGYRIGRLSVDKVRSSGYTISSAQIHFLCTRCFDGELSIVRALNDKRTLDRRYFQVDVTEQGVMDFDLGTTYLLCSDRSTRPIRRSGI